MRENRGPGRVGRRGGGAVGSGDVRQSPRQAARALPAPDAEGGKEGEAGARSTRQRGVGGEGEEPGERALVCK